MSQKLITFIILIFTTVAFGSSGPKQHTINRFNGNINIDGRLNEEVWDQIKSVTNFVTFRPTSGAKPSEKTSVKITYDDEAIYFGAMFYDEPDSIYKRLTTRDNVDSDNFIIHLSPFNDGTQWVEFWITASGVQRDALVEPKSGWNENWNGVWQSEVAIVDSGWIAEVKIPFNLLRIPDKEKHVWGFNMFRQIRRKSEEISWNQIELDGPSGTYFFSTQQGELHGIKDISPGIKLMLWPYASVYSDMGGSPVFQNTQPKIGLDLKYGINESFNLDMILIPDFSQVKTDDRVLNLTPFEIQYDEQRQFFNEGVALFNKGDIFYSRRIGDTPAGNEHLDDNLQENEIVKTVTEKSRILNATKLTGRTEAGLGLGFLNAITAREEAVVLDTITHKTRKLVVQLPANYNVFVADQTLGGNSHISFINTNTFRKQMSFERGIEGQYYVANVNALDAKVYFGDYALTAVLNNSYKPIENKYRNGLSYDLTLSKENGDFRFFVNREFYSNNYDPNDMGYLRRNNMVSNAAEIAYNITDPVGYFLEIRNSLTVVENRQYRPNHFADLTYYHNFYLRLKNQWSIHVRQRLRPKESYDFYESRVEGRYYIGPKYYSTEISFRTNMQKSFAIRPGIDLRWDYDINNCNTKEEYIEAWYKISSRLSLNYEIRNRNINNEYGFIEENQTDEQIYFARRDIHTVENSLGGSYIFTTETALDLRARHYYSTVDNKDFYLLKNNGRLKKRYDFSAEDFHIDDLMIDLSFIWHFQPGSRLSVLLRHHVFDNIEKQGRYVNSLLHSFETTGKTSISIKFLYYLDSNDLGFFSR